MLQFITGTGTSSPLMDRT